MPFGSRTPLLLAALATLPASASGREDASAAVGDPAGRRIEGRVLDESGQPLAGARVVARRRRDEPTPEPRRPRHARSDETGRFRISDLAPGTWDVDVDGPGHVTARIGVHLRPDGPAPAPVEVRLRARPGRAPAAEHGVAPSDGAGPTGPPPIAPTAPEAHAGVDSDDPATPPADAFTAADPGAPPDEPAAEPGVAPGDGAGPATPPPIATTAPEARPGAHSDDPAAPLADAFTATGAGAPGDEPAAGSAAPDGAAAGGINDRRAETRRALEAGRVSRARSLVGTLEGARPGDADLFYAVGEALLRAGETQDAVSLLEQAVARDPAHAEARYRRALGLLGLGRRLEARDEFERVLELSPEGPLAEGARTALAELGGDGGTE